MLVSTSETTTSLCGEHLGEEPCRPHGGFYVLYDEAAEAETLAQTLHYADDSRVGYSLFYYLYNFILTFCFVEEMVVSVDLLVSKLVGWFRQKAGSSSLSSSLIYVAVEKTCTVIAMGRSRAKVAYDL